MRRSASRAQSACAAAVAKFEAGAASRSAVSPSSCSYPDIEVEVILDDAQTVALQRGGPEEELYQEELTQQYRESWLLPAQLLKLRYSSELQPCEQSYALDRIKSQAICNISRLEHCNILLQDTLHVTSALVREERYTDEETQGE